jgi:superfamily II DNA or RNA helicase
MDLRSWQSECLETFNEHRLHDETGRFVFEACPGAGKSLMAATLAWEMLNNEEMPIHFVLVIVPWKSIQGDVNGGMIKTFDRRGLSVRDRFFVRGARIVQQPVPTQLDAVVTTYAEVMNEETVDTLRMWKSRGLRFAVVFDEVHHANESNGSWGEYAEQIDDLCDYTVVMSGTYFRTDGHKIKFVDYNDNGAAEPHYQYSYTSGVRDQYVRPCAFSYTNVELQCIGEDGRETHDLFEMPAGDKRIGKVMREVFDPEGDCVRRMIHQVDEDLKWQRRKFGNAACLFTCRPGRNDSSSDKHVHQIAQKIRQYTGRECTVVTHKDRNAAGKIDAFRNGSGEYLVAVNMISEGVDIPRIRSVAMMRYISSEMMFRQIVGRSLRWITGEDDGTAAKIYLPKFRQMHEFALNMEGESLQGVIDRTCDTCGEYPCICEKELTEGTADIRTEKTFEVLGQKVLSGGGSLSADEVAQFFIDLGERIIRSNVQHTGANNVQLGHALQLGAAMGANEAEPAESDLQRVETARRRVNRLINKLAGKKYGGDYKACWNAEWYPEHKVSWQVAKQTWGLTKLERVVNDLEEKLEKAYRG